MVRPRQAVLARMTITNDTEGDRLLFIEPEAADFWLRSGETFELVAEAQTEDAHFELHDTRDGLTVFPSRHMSDIIVRCGDQTLSCGHQRPDSW